MVFSWALYVCQKMVESCVWLAGFSADALLMDRHRAPAMTRESSCFGVMLTVSVLWAATSRRF